MNSLLAHLYDRIKGSPEDLATLSLTYILENSASARKAFCDFIADTLNMDRYPGLFFRTQVVGEELERPDLVGFDGAFNEVLIIESKFWAGLTKNQPLGYLKRLSKSASDTNKALLFICPDKRKISLWGELIRVCGIDLELDKGQKCGVIDGISLGVVSWREVLGIIKYVLAAEHSILLNDLHQLEGLCDRMDEDAFIPFTPEDFGVDRAKRNMSLYSIVDKCASDLITRLGANADGLRATPQYGEYSRYLVLNGCGISVKFSYKNWIKYAETPFWLTIMKSLGKEWVFAEEAYQKLRHFETQLPRMLYVHDRWQELLIPLYAPSYAQEDEVIESLVKSVEEIFSILE